ncbi:GAF domain-containing protein [Catellatospora sp. TT07R-123]|uniref:GAF and ANTAR domain-containing protein n=1 Tax=Catellatospora sp. TT07R-123 TaxID=2733863 RepID=UPI001AFFC9DB|nr:GAF and ANTAR domain-containing protein [Catellatospora sp. TT07R-123]GHJ43471.1 GAF domain-containing protein [Catellatospora sp. TT07R-123]
MTVDDRYAQVEGLISREPASGGEDGGGIAEMRRLCNAAVRALAARGAGVTVMARGGLRGMTAASDPAAEKLEELQVTLGEGPCREAFEGRRPVLVPDLADGAMARWPVYAPEAQAGGVRAVFSFPLQVGAARLGVMDVFRGRAGMLSPEELALALAFAEVAVATLLRRDGGRPYPAEDWLDRSMGSRAELFQAQGMVSVQLSVGLAEAMVRIRAHAYAHDRRLPDVAADIVARRLRIDGPRP